MPSLLRIPELRILERAAAGYLPPGELMARAGRAAARVIALRLPPGKGNGTGAAGRARVLLLCGPGDNGGDGFTCALELRRIGVECTCWAPQPSRTPDAARARAAWTSGGGVTVDVLPGAGTLDLVVDAIFGIGLSRAPGAPWSEALAWAAAQPAPVVALDLPSGLDADTGNWVGGVAQARAELTVTFLADKPGLHTGHGPEATRDVIVETLGIDAHPLPPVSAGRLVGARDFPAVLRPRARNAHKGDEGAVCVVGGAAGMTGAAILAARAALRLGAGRVYVDLLGRGAGWDPLQPELMFRALADAPARAVIVAGCGLGAGEAARAALAACMARDAPLVLDADALNLLDRARSGGVQSLRARSSPCVLTPHPLEAARLLGCACDEVQKDRIAAALRIAAQSGAFVVLKGAGSVIAGPDGSWAINPTGSAALATAGSGDALAGMIGALAAQGYEFAQAVFAAVWLHGRAGELQGGDVGLVAGEIAGLAAKELVRLRPEQ
jgi:hydroxyethylthiazole kinase-like uncharacterized protein yjeF